MHPHVHRPARLLPALGLALLLGGCGAGISTASPTSAASTAPVATATGGAGQGSAATGATGATGAAGAGGATASPAMATTVSHSGTSVTVTVSLTGPAAYEGGCVRTLEAHLVDPGGKQVGTLPPSGVNALHCLAIAIMDVAGGETAHFSETLVAPGPGTFGVVGTLRGVGAIPKASVTV